MAVLMKNLVARAPKMEDAVAINEQAKRLFEREGYTPIRRFWRIAVGPNDSHEKSARPGDFKADLDVDSLNLVGASQLYDLDAIYIIREYAIYEKELPASELHRCV